MSELADVRSRAGCVVLESHEGSQVGRVWRLGGDRLWHLLADLTSGAAQVQCNYRGDPLPPPAL